MGYRVHINIRLQSVPRTLELPGPTLWRSDENYLFLQWDGLEDVEAEELAESLAEVVAQYEIEAFVGITETYVEEGVTFSRTKKYLDTLPFPEEAV
jgi:hypothetical protein